MDRDSLSRLGGKNAVADSVYRDIIVRKGLDILDPQFVVDNKKLFPL